MSALFRVSEQDSQAHGEIHALLHAAFAYMEGRIDPPSSLHRLTLEGIAKHAACEEIWAIGSPVIACVFLTRKPGALYLGKLAVAGSHRGRGLARSLVESSAARARALSLSVLELQTRIELTENQAAFERMGFRRTAVGRHPGYARTTECTMQRAVPPAFSRLEDN